jgi:hypothetical protein
MSEFEKAKELRNTIETDCKNAIELLEKIKKNSSEFYNLMRWENLGCSQEEYEKLYGNFIYPYEENNIQECLEILIQFFNQDSRKEM